ncbi:helix-turn-helix domain-containing protein [Micromonospora sp. RP3T]|uniref:helix-turn-helix domain-containing protein n=1 Tax=Micromonospora sp. RP3T TaxID=2135446 RepID=UPI003D75A394
MPRAVRAVAERRALGRVLRAHRLALGLTIWEVKEAVKTGKHQLHSVEGADQDVVVGTLVDVAAVYGLHVALAGEHHRPLLTLDACDVAALLAAAAAGAAAHPAAAPVLDRLTAAATP